MGHWYWREKQIKSGSALAMKKDLKHENISYCV